MNKEQKIISKMVNHNNEVWDKLYEMKEKIEQDNDCFVCETCLEIKDKIDNLMLELLDFNIKMSEEGIRAIEEKYGE